MTENVLVQRDFQGALDGFEIMHGHGQGAVHVEHPVAAVLPAHFQSSRRRVRPSWATEATNWPARLKMLARENPRAVPVQGLSMADSSQWFMGRLPWNHRAW